jgi:hypothetical protein
MIFILPVLAAPAKNELKIYSDDKCSVAYTGAQLFSRSGYDACQELKLKSSKLYIRPSCLGLSLTLRYFNDTSSCRAAPSKIDPKNKEPGELFSFQFQPPTTKGCSELQFKDAEEYGYTSEEKMYASQSCAKVDQEYAFDNAAASLAPLLLLLLVF